MYCLIFTLSCCFSDALSLAASLVGQKDALARDWRTGKNVNRSFSVLCDVSGRQRFSSSLQSWPIGDKIVQALLNSSDNLFPVSYQL